ncbi:MAG: hypothetical protein LLF95_11165 [Bacteroidales bacterium]|nr:hypothetical protein [Bacteroidales bacterium]
MAKITYTDKTDKVAVTDPERQISAADMNEIKEVVGNNYDEFSIDKCRHFLNPSCYDIDYFKEMDGLIISLIPLVNISKYGQLYLQYYSNKADAGLFAFCNEMEILKVGYQNHVGTLNGYQILTLLDLDTQEEVFKVIVNTDKMDVELINHGLLLPLFLPKNKITSNSDYFLGRSLNYGKIANLNIPVSVQGIKFNELTVKIAEDEGILPTNTAAQNSTALNAALNGGNVALYVGKPGIYQIGAKIKIYDNTLLCNSIGVVYKKTINDYAFVNVGADSRTKNSNIQIHNLEIDSNNLLSTISGLGSPALATYGLRGAVSFFGINNLRLTGYVKIYNEGDVGVHLADWYDVAVENVFIDSHGDAFHINNGNKLRGKNFEIHSGDDGIPLNACDWINSSPSVGDISDIVIEGYTDFKSDLAETSGQTMRNLLGAWVDWHLGIEVMIGDTVASNGNLYRCYAPYGLTTYISQTEPNRTNDGLQADAGGFSWKYTGSAVVNDITIYKANIFDVMINGLHSLTDERHICNFTIDNDQSWYGRSLHPEVDVANYPFVKNINFKDVYKPTWGKGIYAGVDMTNIPYEYRLINWKGIKAALFDNIYTSPDSTLEIYNSDFEFNQISVKTGLETEAIIINCKELIMNADVKGKIICNSNIETLPTTPISESLVYYENNLYQAYAGNWEKV